MAEQTRTRLHLFHAIQVANARFGKEVRAVPPCFSRQDGWVLQQTAPFVCPFGLSTKV